MHCANALFAGVAYASPSAPSILRLDLLILNDLLQIIQSECRG
jgi:hypothetical protein